MKTYAHRAPAALVSLAFLLAATLPLSAQLTPQQDPANLAGERVSPPDLADTLPINHGAPALEQLLRKLRTRASFMLIVAHPDDEDGGLLTYLSRGQGARVAMLTLNRGEGGQNLMSADFDDALGLIRTQELLAADRYMGVDQFFGTEVDFGFSKTKEESFAKWGHDRVLYDAVRAIRLYRPLVIASVFIGAPSDGHGQHQVSGEIAQEAFKAAGDPSVFPDQIAAGLQPWQPLKVYARIPFARIDAQGMYDYAISAYVPPRFTNYVTGKVTDTVPKANVVIPEGTSDPLLGGLSYVQFARQGLALQKSQIGQGVRLAAAGRADVSYHRYGSKLNQPDGDDSGLEPSLFDGIDTTLPGIASLAPDASPAIKVVLKVNLSHLAASIEEAEHTFAPNNPESAAPALQEALGTVDFLLAQVQSFKATFIPLNQRANILHELHIKRVQLNNALVLAHGLRLEATLSSIMLGAGPPKPKEAGRNLLTSDQEIGVSVKLANDGPQSVKLRNTTLVNSDGLLPVPSYFHSDSANAVLAASSTKEFSLSGATPNGILPTRPYFSRPDIEQPFYDVSSPALRNAPATPGPAIVEATLQDNGANLELTAAIAYSTGDKKGQQVAAVPLLSVQSAPFTELVPLDRKSVTVTAVIATTTVKDPLFVGGAPPCETPCTNASPKSGQGTVGLRTSSGWQVQPAVAHFAFPPPDKPASVSFVLAPPTAELGSISNLSVVAGYDHQTYSEGYRPVGYPGIPYTNYYTPATVRVVPVDVHTAPDLKVAYLPGTGDDVPSYLPSLGITPTILTLADLTAEHLKQYDAVILGVRAYTAHPELAGAGSQPLIEYAHNGGVVILQYNNGRYGDAEAPYPISTPGSSGDHAHDVVDETAPVALLAPDSPLLTWPNKITASDFNGWVAERGHAFAGTWSSEYTPLLETHDPNQPPQKGGLLIARVGSGSYIYCGLALYRQLPEGVPGAYRLLANLISAAKNPGLQSAPAH